MRKGIAFIITFVLLFSAACGESAEPTEAPEAVTEIIIMPNQPVTLLETEDYKIWFTGRASNQFFFGHFDLYVAFENNSDVPSGASARDVKLNGWNHDMIAFTGTLEPGEKKNCLFPIFYGAAMLSSPAQMKELAFDLHVFQLTDDFEGTDIGRFVFVFDPSCWGG